MNNYLSRYLLLLIINVVFLLQSFTTLAQTKDEFDVIIFYVPKGLTSNKTTNNVTLTELTADGNFSITINRSIISLRKIEKTFPVFWKESMSMDGFDNPSAEPQFVKFTNNAGWDVFRGGKMVSYSTHLSPSMYYHLTIIKHFGITIRIVTKAAGEELFIQKMPLLMELLASIDLKKQQPQPVLNNGSNQNTNSTNSGNLNNGYSNTSVQVETYALYMCVQGDLMTNAEISVLYFLPDGTVYTDIPEKGFAGFNVQEQKAKTPEMFGNYSSSEGKVMIRMNGETNSVSYNSRPDRTLQLLQNPEMVYKKIEPLNNFHLEGTYIKKQENNDINFTFTRDGRFTDNGLIKNITANNVNNYPGNGNYSISKNTLLLNYTDGRSVQLSMYLVPEDYQQGNKPSRILINNYVLTSR